jgi:uncharacterized protein with von Willebrand factor type A (vWA) domain
MEQVLENFITALRRSGLSISLSESLDAVEALRVTGYADKEILKEALATTLAKTREEKSIFDECFDRFFSHDPLMSQKRDAFPETDLGLDEQDSALTRMILTGDRAGLALSMRKAAERVDLGGIRFFTQKSLYIQRVLEEMGMEFLDLDMAGLSEEDTPSSLRKKAALGLAKASLFELVKDFVERQFSLFAGAVAEEIAQRSIRNADLSNLEQQDLRRMQTIVRRMVKRLKDRHARRMVSSRRGRLDIKKTLRKNVAYQGLLFDPGWKRKKVDRPEIVAICDVSRSVEAVSHFMLLFLYSLSEAVVRIRSFLLCSNLVEVSRLFENKSVEEALTRLQRGVGIGLQLGRTDYGQALRDFKENFLDTVTRRTTVLILGDARNNYGDPETGILRLIHDRSKRLIWLNPEPPNFYGTGDSEMKRYLPHCSAVRRCSSVRHLERLADFLLQNP